MNKTYYIKFINELKQEILNSRLKAAKLVNKELLILYYTIGKRISLEIHQEGWGAKVIETISNDLQKKLPGLRGFSSTNLKYMKQFYEAYAFLEVDNSVLSFTPKKLKNEQISQSMTDQFVTSVHGVSRGTPTKKSEQFLTDFSELISKVSFTHHCKIIASTTSFETRLFYIKESVENAWSVATLEYHLETKLYKKKGSLQNNFKVALPASISDQAIQAFRDEYLLDFVNIQNPKHIDERVIEQSIVNNIKQFLLSLGKEFTFMGNQYCIKVGDQEFFIDLLFYHRGLQSLIAFELKSGKFTPEYAGKMSFYLNALNNQMKLSHENPSIGIILCKQKNSAIVEYSFADNTRPIGVGTYKFTKTLPQKLKKYLPPAKALIDVLREAEVEYTITPIKNTHE